jgi:hypothetical protein
MPNLPIALRGSWELLLGLLCWTVWAVTWLCLQDQGWDNDRSRPGLVRAGTKRDRKPSRAQSQVWATVRDFLEEGSRSLGTLLALDGDRPGGWRHLWNKKSVWQSSGC